MNRLRRQFIIGSRAGASPGRIRVAAATLLIAALLAIVHTAHAVPVKIVRTQGGINPGPLITSVSTTNGSMTVGWQSFGRQVPPSSNVVYQVLKCPALKGTNTAWTSIATTTNANSVSIPMASAGSAPASGSAPRNVRALRVTRGQSVRKGDRSHRSQAQPA